MTFQRTIAGLLIVTIAGFAASFYINWKMATQLGTIKAFVEGYVFAEAVAACEKAAVAAHTALRCSGVKSNTLRAGPKRSTAVCRPFINPPRVCCFEPNR